MTDHLDARRLTAAADLDDAIAVETALRSIGCVESLHEAIRRGAARAIAYLRLARPEVT